MSRILVVEDEPAIAESVAYALEKEGHHVALAMTLKAARSSLLPSTDLIVLDWMLPDGSGFDWIGELEAERARGLAIIVLSSRGGEGDRVQALESGADDYVTKPFSPREVVARVAAVLRRLHSIRAPSRPTATSRLVLTAESRRVTFDQSTIELTRVEFDLLQLLLTEPGNVFSRANIIDKVWGPSFALSDRTIDSHVKALRRKLVEAGGSPEIIETVRGVGYRAALEASDS